MCEPESHTRQTCEALENTLVRLNHVNSTPVSLQLAWLVVSFYIGTRDFMLTRFTWLASHTRHVSHSG